MGDPLGSSRVSSHKQNREGVVDAQNGQYRVTVVERAQDVVDPRLVCDTAATWSHRDHREREKTSIGDNIKFLLVLSLDINCTLNPNQVGNAGPLRQRGDPFAFQRNAREHVIVGSIGVAAVLILRFPSPTWSIRVEKNGEV
ncbi:hypothetical protein ACFX11_005135 [Malus domestica]